MWWERTTVQKSMGIAAVVALLAVGCGDQGGDESAADSGSERDTMNQMDSGSPDTEPTDSTQPPNDGESSPHRTSGSLGFTQIHAVGSWVGVAARTCGVTTSDELRCWGEVDSSALPSGSFAFVSAGSQCAIRTDGTVECWGDHPNPSGEFQKLSDHLPCGITEGGDLSCWVENSGTFGDVSIGGPDAGSGGDTGMPESAPHWVEGPFVDIADVENWGICAVRESGEVECWSFHTLENPPTTGVEVSLGGLEPGYTCVRNTDGSVACGGYETADPPSGSYQSVAVSDIHDGSACVVRMDGGIECWEVTPGEGLGDVSPPSGNFTSITIGTRHACALRDDDTVVCWGSNESGESQPPQN